LASHTSTAAVPGAGQPPAPDWYYQGDLSGDEVGYAVACAGDVNGDGYDDLAIGAPHDIGTVDREGLAYVFDGGPNGPDSTPDWQVGSGQKGSLFGAAIGPAGDLNDDGYDDLIVGAPGYNNGTTKTGAVFLYCGSHGGLDATPAWSYVSDQKDSNLGIAASTAGDVNGDGYGDVIVGAHWYDNGELNEGAVLLFYGLGTCDLAAGPDWSFESAQQEAALGRSAATAGDVNGDGFDDVIAGAPYYDGGHPDEGAAFVFYGSANGLPAEPDWTAHGGRAGALFGLAVATAGDVNGDGFDDIVIGAPFYDGGQEDEGRAHVYYGSADGPGSTPAWTASGWQAGEQFGISVASAGDVNGDGYADVVVGAAHYRRDQALEGAALVFFGSARGLTGAPGWVAEGDKAETEFGYAVSAAGRTSADSQAGILVGAPTYRHETLLVGRAASYFGPLLPTYHHFLPLVRRDGHSHTGSH
jgi:hypothetical protein